MNQPIKPGKLIHDRYLVQLILGQGRFNRTYLTEDTHRFKEPCVVKEFSPQIQDPVIRQKTTELFQRQAEILYRIYHPQLANFKEIFRGSQEEEASIFLVQDYIEGETYQNLLNLRRSQDKLFREDEVRDLLQELLSVLKYLHEQGIVHRDICLKNIIQREFDTLPVLIDFSSIKLLSSKSPEENPINAVTGQPKTSWVLSQLGKMSQGAKEQEWEENVSIHSDLYGLGVTAIALLTGKDISQLPDPQQGLKEVLHQQSVSPQLTEILVKMLGKPTESRFESAQEILDFLSREKSDHAIDSDESQTKNLKTTSVAPVDLSSSNAVTSADVITSNMADISLKNFWGCFGKLSLFLLLVGFSGLMGWLAGKTWLVQVLQPKTVSQSDLLTSSPTPRSPSPSLSPLPAPSPSPSPTLEEKSINNTNDALRSRRQALGIDRILFKGLVDQSLAIQDTSQPANKTLSQEEKWNRTASNLLDKLSLLSPEALKGLGRYGIEQRSNWTQQVNQLHLSSRALTNLVNIRFLKDFPELENQNFLDQPLGQVWYAIAFDTVKSLTAKQNYELLVKNTTQASQQLVGKLQPGEGKAYSISLTASKPMEVKLEASPDALLSIYSPTGQEILLDNSRTHQWSGILPESGYYEILVTSKAKEPFDYQLNLSAW